MEQETRTANMNEADQTVISSTDTDFENQEVISSASPEENQKKGVIKKVGLATGTAVVTALGVGLLSSFRSAGAGENPSGGEGDFSNGDSTGTGTDTATEWWQTAPHAAEGVVTDDMSFNEAFAAARKNLGAGGLFEWKGQTYGTFYQEECDENGEPLAEYIHDDIDPAPSDISNPEGIAGTDQGEGTGSSPENNSGLVDGNGEGTPDDFPEDPNSENGSNIGDPLAGNDTDNGGSDNAGDDLNGDPVSNPDGDPEQVDSILANSNTMEYDADDDGYAETVYVDVDKDGHADMIIGDMDHNGEFSEEEVMIINEDALADGAEMGNAEAGVMNVDYTGDGQADMLYTDTDQDGIVDTIVQDSNQDGDYEDEEVAFEIDNSNNIGSLINSEHLADVVEDNFGSDNEVLAEEDHYADASAEEDEGVDDDMDDDDFMS